MVFTVTALCSIFRRCCCWLLLLFVCLIRRCFGRIFGKRLSLRSNDSCLACCQRWRTPLTYVCWLAFCDSGATIVLLLFFSFLVFVGCAMCGRSDGVWTTAEKLSLSTEIYFPFNWMVFSEIKIIGRSPSLLYSDGSVAQPRNQLESSFGTCSKERVLSTLGELNAGRGVASRMSTWIVSPDTRWKTPWRNTIRVPWHKMACFHELNKNLVINNQNGLNFTRNGCTYYSLHSNSIHQILKYLTNYSSSSNEKYQNSVRPHTPCQNSVQQSRLTVVRLSYPFRVEERACAPFINRTQFDNQILWPPFCWVYVLYICISTWID